MVRVVNTSDRDGKGGKEEYLPHASAHPTILGGSPALSMMNQYGKKAHREAEAQARAAAKLADQQPSMPNIVFAVRDDVI